MQTNVQIDTKALRHSPEHGQQKGNYRVTAELQVVECKMNVPVKAGPAPTVAVVPVPESEMDALLLGRTGVRSFDQSLVTHIRMIFIEDDKRTSYVSSTSKTLHSEI
ncbi:unnamed protein product [Danaus chrysippus]|uniref:(African queen) hypothetical protein n=1 Tax=Danaus chrysippus TaxID=151541 RepID=A0A8J2QY15_9NEOP|nr:unnamed protein product [Danaus chrysippus]